MGFRVSLVKIDALKPHEETIQAGVRGLAEEMFREKIVRDPLIVDRDEFVILDGMHRYNALKLMECAYAPCCLIDYASPLIRVGAWFRLYTIKQPKFVAEEILRDANLQFSETKSNEHDPSGQAILLTKDRDEFTLEGSMQPIDRARTGVKLERILRGMSYHADYLSEIVSLEKLKAGQVDLMITMPIFTKSEIRECGLHGKLLPHKVTRHVIPSRPLHVNVPIKLLNEVGTQADMDRKLGEMLALRPVTRLPPGSTVDGRKYEEELLVFGT